MVTVDHKKLGVMYVLYALLFLVVGGVEALTIRIQLFLPDNHFVSAEAFNRLFTMHGTTMVFFVGMPIALRLRQLPYAADDRRARHGLSAAERLQLLDQSHLAGCCCTTALSAAVGLYGAGSAPDVGWFAYAPLTSRAFSRGHSHRLLGAGICSSPASAVDRDGDQLSSPRRSACAARA